VTVRIVRSRQFRGDAEGIAEHYLAEAGLDVALRFFDELEHVVERLAAHPGLGSTRYAQADMPWLRSLAMPSFPYVVFFGQTTGGLIRLWRVLHGRRDLPRALRDADFPDGE
jgi:toxin ParE1/3/4